MITLYMARKMERIEILKNETFKFIEASSLPSKHQVTCDLVVSKHLVAFKRRCENVLVAFTGSHCFANS